MGRYNTDWERLYYAMNPYYSACKSFEEIKKAKYLICETKASQNHVCMSNCTDYGTIIDYS